MEQTDGGREHLLGLALAVGSAALQAAGDASQKALAESWGPLEAPLAFKAGMTAMTLGLAFVLTEDDASEHLIQAAGSSSFLVAFAVSGAINAITSWLYLYGLRRGQLVDTLPFLSLTPVFLLVSAYFLLGELPDSRGMMGVLLISLGGFWLSRMSNNVSSKAVDKDLEDSASETPELAAIVAPCLPPGAPTFVLIAMLFSISSAYDKQGVKAVPALVYGASVNTVVGLVALANAGMRGTSPSSDDKDGRRRRVVSRHLGGWSFLGLWWLLSTGSYWFQLEANRRILASHLSAIRRSGVIFAVLLGRVFFGEEVGRRLIPIWTMVLGVTLISLR